ncbi:roadblock/LC7 domain-containing protein [Streptomyces sp. NPDC052036]|uniref:roadblock/LC7 domain-containing protein n=1 Tax=unclassified Streptomyces TaxID=2593676 RepID=UPI00341291D9
MTTYDMSDTADAPTSTDPRDQIAWLLKDFASQIPGVIHALLLSRDGLRLLDSGMNKNWADTTAAALSGLASLAKNIEGPDSKRRPVSQLMFERDDALFFIQTAGPSLVFEAQLGRAREDVDTVLGVIALPDADVGTVGYEMERLIHRFASYMTIPVRHPDASGDVR